MGGLGMEEQVGPGGNRGIKRRVEHTKRGYVMG